MSIFPQHPQVIPPPARLRGLAHAGKVVNALDQAPIPLQSRSPSPLTEAPSVLI